jgi:hypothetical protein
VLCCAVLSPNTTAVMTAPETMKTMTNQNSSCVTGEMFSPTSIRKAW